MKKNLFKRVAAVVLAGTMMMAMGTTVFAADHDGTMGINGDVITFQKTLDMTDAEGATVPDETFEFTITAGTAVAPTSATTPEIYAGVGTPTIGTAVFAHTDTIDNTKLVTKDVIVDFNNVKFPRPGIYRYVVKEDAPVDDDITIKDGDDTRYLDIYVENDTTTGDYKIAHAIMVNSAQTLSIDKDSINYAQNTKDEFMNEYNTYDLSLDKVVAGNMGDKGAEYKFTIAFEGPANASFTYGDKKVTLDQDGNGRVDITLKDADAAAVIKGIPSTVKYTITENINENTGYKVDYKRGGENITSDTYAVSEEQTMGKADHIVTCTNTKDGITPTGIIMNVAPYVAMVAVAVVLAVVFLGRKRREF